MFTEFKLKDGKKVDTPWLDGVLERALKLVAKWVKKNPELESIPDGILFLNALNSADTQRIVEAFKAAGFDANTALHYAESHLPESFIMTGLLAFLSINTWYLKLESQNPTASPTDFGLKVDAAEGVDFIKERITEEELHEFMYSEAKLPEVIGPESTGHILKACIAYDRWVRSHYKPPKKQEKEQKKSLVDFWDLSWFEKQAEGFRKVLGIDKK